MITIIQTKTAIHSVNYKVYDYAYYKTDAYWRLNYQITDAISYYNGDAIARLYQSTNAEVATYDHTIVLSNKGYLGGDNLSGSYNPIYGYRTFDETVQTVSETLFLAYYKCSVYSDIKGYYAGGYNGTYYQNVQSFSFFTETMTNANSLSATRAYGTGISSTLKGYYCGGTNGTITNNINTMTFDTEATVSIATVLTRIDYSGIGINSNTKGYYCGGYNNGTKIDVINFTNDACALLAAALPVNRNSASGTNSTLKGYISGSQNAVNSIDGITFATEATATIAATLITGRSRATGINSSTCGYNIGGNAVSEIDGINFANDTTINPANYFSVALTGCAGVDTHKTNYVDSVQAKINSFAVTLVSDNSFVNHALTVAINAKTAVGDESAYDITSTLYNKGYIANAALYSYQTTHETSYTIASSLSVNRSSSAGVSSNVGGYYASGTGYSSVDGITFATEAYYAIVATLYAARTFMCGISGLIKGYYAGGQNSGTGTTTIQTIAYDSNTIATLSATLTVLNSSSAGVNSGVAGYVCGGSSSPRVNNKIVFATDTCAAIMSSTRNYSDAPSGTNSSTAGYIGGGNSSSAIDKLLFATDSITTLSATLVIAGYAFASVNSNDKGFTVGGFGRLGEVDAIVFATDTIYDAANFVTSILYGVATDTHKANYINSISTKVNSLANATVVSDETSYNHSIVVNFNQIVLQEMPYYGQLSVGIHLNTIPSDETTYDNTFSMPNKGYIKNGDTVYAYNTDGENSLVITATLNANGNNACGVYSGDNGYYCGSSSWSNIVDKINFASETTTKSIGTLSATRGHSLGICAIAKGYICGGQNSGTVTNVIQTLTFASETISTISATMPIANEDGATTFNVTVGYMCGGYHNTSNIFKLSYATELCSTLVAVLHNKDSSSGTMSQVAGYVAGGYTGDTTAIDKLNFATESIVELTARISVGGYRMSSISGITNGYVIGGIGRSYTIDSINFATDSTRIVTPSNSFSNSDGAFVDTHNNINVNVVTKYINSFDTIELVDYSQFDSVVYAIHETHFASDESYYSMEFVSGVKGYIAYGTALYGYGTVTEYSFLVSATLAANRQYSTGVYSSTNGYFTGGYGYLASIEGFVFSTESCYAVGASLSAGRARIVGNESLVKGYYCGGNGSSVVAIATIQALTFSNDTVATLASSQPNINYNGAGVSSSTDGYICGGDSNANVVYKLNFVSEICSTLSASITTRNTQPSGTGSSVAGYIVGGNSSCSIAYDKILYANDTVSVLSATIPIIRGGISGVSSATNGYNVGGGTTIDGINFVTDTSINIAATLGGSSSYTGAVDTHNAVHVGVNKIVSLANIAMFEETYYSHVNIYEPILQLPATSDQTSYDHVNIYEPILQLPATSDQTSYDHAITIETRGYLRTGTAIYRFNSENDSVDPSTFSIADGIGGKCSFYSSNNGYYIGGGWSYATNAISFASETTYDLGNILYANWYIYQGIGISGIVKGYTCGGYDNRVGVYTYIQAMTFASQTMQLIANTVGNQNGGGTGVNSNIKGYFTNDSNVLNALTFATDSCVSLGVSFAVASIDYSSGTNSSVAGYFAGNSSNVNTISKITFADESRSTLSATLIVGGGYMAAVNCATLGYNVSGNNRSGKIDAINFATDTVVDKGYTSYTFNDGGNAVDNHKSSMSVVNTIYINSFANILLLDEAYYDTTMDAIATRTILSDETSYDHSIVFSFTNKGYLNNISSTAIYSYDSIVSTGFLSTLALTQSGSIKTCYYSDIKGYYCGGNWNNYIEGIQFTNETTFSYANKLFNNYAYYAAAGVSSTTKGYHIAGYTNSVGNISYIQALTFATDTNTYIGNMPVTMAYITGTMSSTNSYISYSTTMYRFSFSSETGVSLGAILAVNRQYATGTMSNVCGYYSGGNSGGSSISRITFATEACATISAVLVTSGYTSGAVNNATTGYNIGGINRASEIDGLTFATETMVNYADALGAIGECYGVDTHKNALVANTLYIVNLNQIVFAKDETYYYNDQIVFSKGYIAYNAGSNVCYRTDDETNVSTSIVITGTGRYIIGSGLESIARGYYCGGSSNNVGTSTCYNNIEVINYATESNFAGTFTLTNPRSLQVGISTYNKGFIFGGANANVSRSDIETLTFATEATSVHTITLSRIERAGTGVNSDAVGYYCGGVSNTTRIEGLVFVSETIATKTATCSVSRDYSVGVSSNVAGYVAGNSSNVSSINKLLFADETVSTSSVTLVAGRYGGADINTLYKGYFVGGTSSSTEIDGIDYATETSINPANILGGITYCSSVDTKPMVVASASPLDVINDIANVLLAQDNSMFGQISVGLHSIPMLSDESYFDSNVYAINHTTDIVDESYYTPYIIDTILSILYTKGYINNDSTSIYGYDTSNESAITVSATITNTASLKASFYSHNKGYWTGGGWSANTDSINFATLTTVNHGNVVYAGTYYYAGVGLSSTDYGYMLGGYDYHYSPSYANSIQRFNFSTNTFALVGYVIPSTLNYASATNGTLAGYVADATTIYKLQFANDTNTTSLGTILSVARNYACGTNSNISGYYSGNSSNTTSISKITFATETCAVLSATLATGGYTSAPVNSGYSGYNIGGNTRSGEIDSINFASETVVNNANVLTSFTEAYGVNTQQYGDISINTQYISNINQITMINDYSEYRGIVYISAKTVPEPVSYYDYIVSITGYKGVVSSSTLLYGYNTQTETAYDIAATLAVTKYGGAGVNSDIKGYYAGNTVYSSAIEAVTFSTLTRATLGVTLGTTNGYIRGYIVGISGYGIGYYCGGYNGSWGIWNVIEALTYLTETRYFAACVLRNAERRGCGVGSEIAGYYCGGDQSSTTAVTKFTFVSEVSTNIAATVNSRYGGASGTNSKDKGYICGGQGEQNYGDKLTFATDTISQNFVTLATAGYDIAAINGGYKGFNIGGTNRTTEIDAINFNTDTLYNAANVLVAITGGIGVDNHLMQYATVLRNVNHTTDIVDESYYTPYIVDTIQLKLYTKGYINNDSTSVYGYDTSNESAIAVSATIANGESLKESFYSYSKGYWCGGGWTPGVNSINFSTITTSNLGNILYAGYNNYASVGLSGNPIKGYIVGSYDNRYGQSNWLTGFPYATETNVLITSGLGYCPSYGTGLNSSDNGYVAYNATIYRISYSTDTSTSLGGILSVNRQYATGTNSLIAGYYSCNSSNVTSTSRITFATESCATISAVLANGGYTRAAVNSGYSGYCVCGITTTSQIVGLSFETETAINPADVLGTLGECYGVNTQQYVGTQNIVANTHYIVNLNSVVLGADLSLYEPLFYVNVDLTIEESYYEKVPLYMNNAILLTSDVGDYNIVIDAFDYAFGDRGYISNAATIAGYKTSDETAIVVGAMCSATRLNGGSIYSTTNGYFAGNSSWSNSIDTLNYSSVTTSTLSATLSAGRGYIAGMCGTIKGYYVGGSNGGTVISTIESCLFATNAQSTLSVALPAVEKGGVCVNYAYAGYYCGGDTSSNTAIRKMTFEVETTSTLVAAIESKYNRPSGTNNFVAGYVSGGTGSTGSVDKLVYNTETVAILSAVLVVVSSGLSSINSNYNGYNIGGSRASNEIDGIAFASDTTINPINVLATTSNGGCGVSVRVAGIANKYYVTISNATMVDDTHYETITSTPKDGNTIGYMANGTAVQGYVTATEAAKSFSATISFTPTTTRSFYSTYRGYFVGVAWAATVDCITFDTETTLALGSIMYSIAGGGATNCSNAKGYYTGGSTNGSTNPTNIQVMPFATQTFANLVATATFATYNCASSNSDYKGYFTNTAGTGIDALTFATEACVVLSATFAVARTYAGCTNSTLYGYYSGNSNNVSSISTLSHYTETTLTLAAILVAGRGASASVNCANRGYNFGGITQATENDAIEFVTDTVYNAANVLSYTSSSGGRTGVNTSPLIVHGKAYFAGGEKVDATLCNEIDKYTFYTETNAASSATLNVARSFVIGVYSSTKGYVAGGFTTTASSTIEALLYSNESVSTLSATLSLARYGCTSSVTPYKGYYVGGFATDYVSEIDGILYSNESETNIAATLSVVRYMLGSVQTLHNAYYAGGTNTTGNVTEIDGLSFVTETSTNPSIVLSVARYGVTGVYSNTNGYYAGGYSSDYSSEIDGIVFATETATNTSSSLTVARYGLTSTQERNKGYFVGGYTGTNYSSTIDSLSLFTETVYSQAATLTTSKELMASTIA